MPTTPINILTVLCDPRRVRHIAITCRCGRRWVELIPAELHDSQLTAALDCPSCGQRYTLRDKQLTRMEDYTDDPERQTKTTTTHIDTSQHYDS